LAEYWIRLNSWQDKNREHRGGSSGAALFYVKRTLINLGIVFLESSHGNQIRVTGLERTMADLFRNRNRMDMQMFHDALKRYVGKKDRNLDMLNTYA
jgi:hypothetical protein